ncbi:MAG TPA: phosphoribosyl-AMP cyclohydrolase, partial [Candidatus Limnocylindrales bacterium]|nr:phosphoribosyl-AMP cyclohydrolase [Candidatus Limnocylindrales bacterium]
FKAQELQPLKAEQLKYDKSGLIPAVIQDYRNGAVLMVGYMNQEAVNRTSASGKVCFWSRSRQEYWVKGETSGNIFQVKSINADCDADALLIKVIPQGAGVACHTGSYSCFFNNLAAYDPEKRGDLDD